MTVGDRGAGAEWTTFVQNRCAARVRNAVGIVPPEIPATATSAHVQVSGSLVTTCKSGRAVPAEFIAATVLVIRVGPGRWLVAKREF